MKPLNALISGENATKKKKPVEWNEWCQIAFDKLKELCTSTPILAYTNYKKEFQLHTDVSELGLGGGGYVIKRMMKGSKELLHMQVGV